MPVPQILALPGMNSILDSTMTGKLSKVNYSSRYALGLFYDTSLDFLNGTQYTKSDEVFAFVSNDPSKRQNPNQPISVVFLTTTSWGLKHLETPIPEVEKILTEQYKSRYPNWPQPSWVKCQRWRYSQVLQPFEGCPKAVILQDKPLLIAAGDGFVAQNATVDGCIASAHSVMDILKSKL